MKHEDVIALRMSYGLPDTTLVLGNVGRIVPHKNIAFVVDVMAELRKRGMDVAFVVAGRDDTPDYTNEIRQKAYSMGIPQDRLLFLGERGDIPTVMHTFDIFVGPALKEGFGLVAVEAQAAGIPCVLYVGFPETVDMHIGLCKRIRNFDVSEWTQTIESTAKLKLSMKKEDIHVAIQNKGFDAKMNSIKVCRLYSQRVDQQVAY